MVNRLPARLLRQAEWYAERATRAFLAGDHGEALACADKAVRMTARIRRRDPGQQAWTDRLGERMRRRAEIHQALAAAPAAIADAAEAIRLFEQVDTQRYPLRIPDVQILLCELHAKLGQTEAAVRNGQAIERYRAYLATTAADQTLVARALARYAAAMYSVGETYRAEAATREALDLLRPQVSTARRVDDVTLFARMAYLLAAIAGPPARTSAPAILTTLQEAVGPLARTVPESPAAFSDPAHRDRALGVLTILEQQAIWLETWGARRLAALYERYSRDLVTLPVHQWPNILAQLHGLLCRALELGGDPPEVP